MSKKERKKKNPHLAKGSPHRERGVYSTVVEQRMTAEPYAGGGCLPPLQLTTGLVVNSFITTNSHLAGEHMLLIPKVSIQSEQIYIYIYIQYTVGSRFAREFGR